MHVFKFRPSSHSDDYTVIASFNSLQDASLAFSALEIMLEDMRNNPEDYSADWSPDEASVCVNEDKRRLRFDVNSGGYLSEVVNLMMKVGASKIEVYKYYQKLTISLEVPAGIPLETITLILDEEEVEAMRWLLENCGRPAVEEDGEVWRYVWTYAGDGIYDEEENTLILESIELDLDGRENWFVEEIYDEWWSIKEDSGPYEEDSDS